MSEIPPGPGKKTEITPPPANEPRLESWGEIALYLRRDIRTVQRWEKELALPVRRLMIGKQGQVYAYRSELDRWILERQPKAEAELTPDSPALPATPDSRAVAEEKQAGVQGQVLRFWKPVLIAAVVLSAGAYLYFVLQPHPTQSALRVPTKNLLFVRPFANLSSDPAEKEFVDGLTDEMITQLGRANPKSIGVFAPTTSKELATMTIRELKQTLKADFVLEGSVRRANDQLRIDIDLISTADQTPTWTNSYTGNLREVLPFQDEVTNDVARHITLALPNSSGGKLPSPGASLHPSGNRDVDPQVYEAYLAGRVSLLDRDFPRSMAAFQRALRRDPKYAPALAGFAMSYLLLGETPNDALRPTDALPRARQSARQALDLDPNISDAYCVLANISQGFDHDLREAERLYLKAIEVDPTNVTAHKWYGDYLFVTSRLPEAVKQINLALELDPVSPLLNTASSEVKYYQRDFDGALAQAQRTLDQHPDFILARFWLASSYRQKKMFPQAIAQFDQLRQSYPDNPAMLMAYGHALAVSGDRAAAKKVLNELQALSHTRYVPAAYIAGIYTGLGDLDQAFHWLDEGYKQKNDRLVYLGVDPLADPLRGDPRFPILLKKVGLQ